MKLLAYEAPLVYKRLVRNSMACIFSTILFLFLSLPFLQAQEMPDKIKTKIVAADSVWIISHKVTGVFVRNKKGVSTERTLFQKGKLNQALVIESVLLTGADKERLASILARPLEDDIPETAKCFFAHHAIIWKKGKTVSWVDVCFSCHTLRQSKDIEYSLAALIRVNGRNCKRFLHKKGYQGMWMISERWAIQNQLSKTAVKC